MLEIFISQTLVRMPVALLLLWISYLVKDEFLIWDGYENSYIDVDIA